MAAVSSVTPSASRTEGWVRETSQIWLVVLTSFGTVVLHIPVYLVLARTRVRIVSGCSASSDRLHPARAYIYPQHGDFAFSERRMGSPPAGAFGVKGPVQEVPSDRT